MRPAGTSATGRLRMPIMLRHFGRLHTHGETDWRAGIDEGEHYVLDFPLTEAQRLSSETGN